MLLVIGTIAAVVVVPPTLWSWTDVRCRFFPSTCSSPVPSRPDRLIAALDLGYDLSSGFAWLLTVQDGPDNRIILGPGLGRGLAYMAGPVQNINGDIQELGLQPFNFQGRHASQRTLWALENYSRAALTDSDLRTAFEIGQSVYFLSVASTQKEISDNDFVFRTTTLKDDLRSLNLSGAIAGATREGFRDPVYIGEYLSQLRQLIREKYPVVYSAQ